MRFQIIFKGLQSNFVFAIKENQSIKFIHTHSMRFLGIGLVFQWHFKALYFETIFCVGYIRQRVKNINHVYHNYRPQRSWGKVIFSEACVKNSVHRRACMAGGVRGGGPCIAGGMCGMGACMAEGGMCGRGLCMVGGGMRGRGACVADTTRYCQ